MPSESINSLNILIPLLSQCFCSVFGQHNLTAKLSILGPYRGITLTLSPPGTSGIVWIKRLSLNLSDIFVKNRPHHLFILLAVISTMNLSITTPQWYAREESNPESLDISQVQRYHITSGAYMLFFSSCHQKNTPMINHLFQGRMDLLYPLIILQLFHLYSRHSYESNHLTDKFA